MKQVKFAAIFLVAFVSGLLVGDWKPGIVGRLKVRLGVQARMLDTQSPYYRSKLAFFRQTAGVADAVMLGDSHIEMIDWRELFPGVKILNRGISGDTSEGVLNWLDEVIGASPKNRVSHDWRQRHDPGLYGIASSITFFEQPMWLAQLNAVLWAKPFIIPAPAPMIWGLAHLRQRFVRRCHGRKRPQPFDGPGQVKQSGSKVEFGPSRSARQRTERSLVTLPTC